jgi:hypothetical protein
MTICHRTPSGQAQTLTLPIQAAEAHLREHPLDTPGICPVDVPADVEAATAAPAKKKPAKKKPAKKSS